MLAKLHFGLVIGPEKVQILVHHDNRIVDALQNGIEGTLAPTQDFYHLPALEQGKAEPQGEQAQKAAQAYGRVKEYYPVTNLLPGYNFTNGRNLARQNRDRQQQHPD
jgi:hypothetical protein